MSRITKIAAREAMQRLAYDPVEELVKIAQDVATPRDQRIQIAQTLAPFSYPKLAAMTIGGDEDAPPISMQLSREFMFKILNDPNLADAAQKLSLVAAESTGELEEATRALPEGD